MYIMYINYLRILVVLIFKNIESEAYYMYRELTNQELVELKKDIGQTHIRVVRYEGIKAVFFEFNKKKYMIMTLQSADAYFDEQGKFIQGEFTDGDVWKVKETKQA